MVSGRLRVPVTQGRPKSVVLGTILVLPLSHVRLTRVSTSVIRRRMGIPWWPSGQDSALSPLGPELRSLVGELILQAPQCGQKKIRRRARQILKSPPALAISIRFKSTCRDFKVCLLSPTHLFQGAGCKHC